ncbi:Ankyrin repeat domain-containing protein 7 [Mytilus coruscus]|uniref:Ankyrin repeat domain-containing protein 7 n=1 Tax=Mytilus coruscus TaxID=42192 RepID=A0A6J8AR05_MYTCO|nr:Ankyrin repeat domain-containing protein 7 [Mytilus coruscus]
MKKFFGKLGKKKGEPGRPTPPPSPNLGAVTEWLYVGYEVREKDLPKLHKAVWNDDLVKVKSLVKKDVNGLDKENRTPLHLACVKGSKPIVQELLEWHAKPNIGDNEGKTPLLKAVECKKEDCVMLLLQHTADVDTRDRLGDTAVHVAVKNSFTNILRLLIKSGADINIRNKSGFAPLHLAVMNKKDEVTKILLQNKADFDVMDGDGRTPLMYACYEGAITQVKDLITVGADTQIKDTKGFNAEDIANQKGQHACSHLLIEHNNKQSGSVASTPRMPSISSRTTTPRQESSDLMFGLPATNMANDYDSDEDGTFSKSAGDDSWKSDADMSLSLHGKRSGGLKLPSPTLDDTDEEVEMPREEGATPKVNLAKALNRITTGSDASDNEALRSCLRKNSSFSDKEGDSEGHEIPVKRLSAKSIQSVTSAEIEWSDEDENSPVNTPRKSSSSKVSFIDKDVSEIHEITATESETDDGGEYQGSEAKRPKYDHTFQQQQNSGYTPTGLTGVANDELSQQKLKVENEYANSTDFMKDIGLEDDDVDDFTSTPDISEMSEPIETAPKPPENPPAQSKHHDSDWDSTEPGVTPRTQKSILKTSNRQYEGEAQQQIQQKKPLSPRSDEETSEWDSDVEDMLDPKKKKDINEGMNIDQESPRHLGKRFEVRGDGSVSGIGDSPIVIRETQDLTEDNIPKTPVTLEKETPKAVIEESEDEQQNIIDFDRTDSWDSDTDGFNTGDEQVDGNKMFEIGEDGSIQGVGMSPIELHDDEDQEVDSEVAEVFKAEDEKSLSYKEDISHSVKQILPSPGEGQDEGQPSKEFNLVLDEGRESQGFDLDVHDDDQDSSSRKNQEEMESQRPSFEERQEAVEEFAEQSISQNIGGHSEFTLHSVLDTCLSLVSGCFLFTLHSVLDTCSSLVSGCFLFTLHSVLDTCSSLVSGCFLFTLHSVLDTCLSLVLDVVSSHFTQHWTHAHHWFLDVVCSHSAQYWTHVHHWFVDVFCSLSTQYWTHVHNWFLDVVCSHSAQYWTHVHHWFLDVVCSHFTQYWTHVHHWFLDVVCSHSAQYWTHVHHWFVDVFCSHFTQYWTHVHHWFVDVFCSHFTQYWTHVYHWFLDIACSLSTQYWTHVHNWFLDVVCSHFTKYWTESGGSNWDSSNDAATPRGPPSRLTTSAIVVGVDEDEEDEDFDEEAEVPVQVPVHQEIVEEPHQEVIEETVDALNHTGGSHISYVTTDSHSSKNTVIQVTKDQDHDQPEDIEDEDSEWDSDEDIDCVDNVSPPIGVSPIVRGSEFSVEEEEEEDEESVSEWELERLREKEHKQKLEEEAERRREEELERQREAKRLAEQEEWEELHRQEQLRREEEEEALRQKLEKEEALKRQMEEDAQRQRMEEEARRQQQEEAHRQQLEEEAHKQHLEEEAHRQQLEEEAHRQKEETQKKEQIQKNGSDKLTKKSSFKDEETSSPRRFEMRRVNLLSVTDFLKSTKSEIYKANVTINKTQQKEGTSSKPVVEESLEKADDLMSFTAPVSAPVVKETASAVQSSYSATPIVEETIQKEDKSRSYTSMKGQVEEGVTSFSSRQPIKTTNTKRDVEKSIDPSKEQKRRPMSLESIDITADDDDESVDMDHVGDPERQDMGSYLRTLPSSYSAYKYNGVFDDDLISLTSTEVDDSMTYQPNTPYGKDILANMNLSDPGTVLKLQDHMHEQNKRLDHERNARITMENKYKSLFKEKNELQKKAEGLNQQRSNLEQEKLDLETRIRNLDYKLSEESEMRKNAETLLSKTKDQLNKKEEQYTSEIEAKQAAELQMRNLQMELRSANNSIKQLEEEKEEYQQQAQHEKNARQMQEQINEEQHRLHEQLQFKQAEIASKQFDAENQLEVADEDRKHAHDSLSILRAELTALKSELEKERDDVMKLLSCLVKVRNFRVGDLKNENKMTEDALTKATMAHSLQLESLKTRLQSSSWEVDKAEQARSEVERRLQYEKEEWTKQLENSQKDNTLLKDQQQTLLHRLSSLEAKLNSVENELHVANTSLLERTNQLQQCQKDLEYYKSAQDNYDQNYKLEKEHNSKLQTKVEGLQEKVTGFQHENLTLKQQLESLQHVLSDRSGEDAHEKFTSMLASLKTENEKARLNLEERNSSLSEQVTKLKDENRSLEGRRSNLEQDNQRLNREYTDMFKKLSVAEASHEVSSKAKEHLDSEKHKLAMDLERTQQKYETAQQKCLELQTRVTEITEHVKKAENVRDQARAELMNTSLNQDEGNKIRQDLEGTLHHIQIDNARLDAELKHERQRVEQLQKDLQDSQKVRSSLEALCSNLKSTNNMLEDKREHVQSDNSMDVSQYEKQRQEALSHLEEERRKARKATEKVKIAETKLEAEQEKNVELQKELATMKGYLKMAKRKLKVLDTSDSRVNTIITEFDKERLTMEGTLSEARQQIASLQQTLESEVDEKEKLHSKNVDLQTKIASLKHLEKNVDKLEKSKYKLEEDYKMYKAKIENGYVNKDELNQKEKELEAHYRLQLNRKLDEINNYLEQQARARERLDNSRDETEYKIKDARRKLEDENTSLKIQNEQIKAQKDSKEMEAKRFRDLYDSEMQWRMRLSEQLVRTTDKAYGYKSKLVAERQRGRIQNNLSFSSPVNGNALDYSRLSMNGDDILSNRLRVELDRSIAKHLEAAPHDNIQPAIRTHDDSIMNSSFAKSSAEYLELLKRKYCV